MTFRQRDEKESFDSNSLNLFNKTKIAFRALLNGIGGFCTERDSGMVKNIKVLLAQLFISTGSVAFLEAYSKITSQKRKAVARIFGIRHGDINNDLKAFEASVTVELKAKKPPAAPPNKPSSNNQDLLKAISDTTRRPAAELQTARVGLETKLSAATINSVVHSQSEYEQDFFV